MEVCGGHTHTIYRTASTTTCRERRAGARPGLPVCVIPMGRVDDAIAIAEQPDVIFTCFGDMMRVPGGNGTCSTRRRAAPTCASCTRRSTRCASPASTPTAGRLLRDRLRDHGTVHRAHPPAGRGPSGRQLLVFCNHVTIVPPIKAILDSPDLRLDGFIGPGHVSTVIGCRPTSSSPPTYGKPLVVAGFEPLDILQAVHMLLRPARRGPLRGGEPVRAGRARRREPAGARA
jgi:hydrogenase expression/formation protein HypD